MFTKRLLASFCLLLCACANTEGITEAVAGTFPERSELIGEYWMGDGLGVCARIDLNADGSYLWTGCGGEHMGMPSVHDSGTWRVDQNVIYFAGGKTSAVGSAESFYYLDRPAFASASDIHNGKVHQWFVFKKAAPPSEQGVASDSEPATDVPRP